MHNAHDAQMHICKHVKNGTEMYSRKHWERNVLGAKCTEPSTGGYYLLCCTGL